MKRSKSVSKRKDGKRGGACWRGYEMIGMKIKNGKTVPNCVPKSKRRSQKKR
jgi:hypothetical protein